MRTLFGLLALFAVIAAPASAQARFVQACAASPEIAQIEGLDGGALCQCIAARSIGRGIPAGDLDRSIDYSAEGIQSAPPEIRAVARVAMESTASCAHDVYGQQREGVAQQATPTAGGPARPPAALPVGIRTGDGGSPVRAEQAGRGAAVRIRG